MGALRGGVDRCELVWMLEEQMRLIYAPMLAAAGNGGCAGGGTRGCAVGGGGGCVSGCRGQPD